MRRQARQGGQLEGGVAQQRLLYGHDVAVVIIARARVPRRSSLRKRGVVARHEVSGAVQPDRRAHMLVGAQAARAHAKPLSAPETARYVPYACSTGLHLMLPWLSRPNGSVLSNKVRAASDLLIRRLLSSKVAKV